MKKLLNMSRFGKGLLAVAAAALALAARGADEARVRAVADEVGGTVTWHGARNQPARVRGKALWTAPARKAGKSAGGGAATSTPAGAAMAAMASLGEMWGVTDPAATLVVRSDDVDSLGYTHVRLRQMYGGLEVDGRELIVHLNAAGDVYEVNGEFLEGLTLGTKPAVTASAAAAAAVKAAKAAGAKSPSATDADATLVVWCDGPDAAKAKLAWKVTVRGGGRRGRTMHWFVDAKTGTALRARPASGAATKATAYIDPSEPPFNYNGLISKAATYAVPAGTATVVTGKLPETQGGAEVSVPAIEAADGKKYLVGASSNGVEIGILDGYAAPAFRADAKTAFLKGNANWFKQFHNRAQWTAWNPGNTREDAPNALAIAYNIGLSLDYFKAAFNRDSYDGRGGRVAAWRFWQDDIYDIDEGYENAFWTSINGAGKTVGCFFFGYNDSGNLSQTSLDTCAHELTHGITSWTSDLQYEGESGALNESFSDLIAAACEFACQPAAADKTDPRPGEADWLFDEDSGEVARSYADPHLYDQPSRYKGSDWASTAAPSEYNDYGGVHSNSGVQNHFFYLLCEGGSGFNDGLEYEPFDGIGVEKAAQLAYRTLTDYCIPTTKYGDIVSCWLSAAQDLYENGVISREDVEKVVFAWNAVLALPDIDIHFDAPTAWVAEGDTAEVTVWGGNATNACTVKVYLVPGSVTASRFSEATRKRFPLTLSWRAGEVSRRTVRVPVRGSSAVTGDQSYYLQLVSPKGAPLGTNALCEVTTADMDSSDYDLFQSPILTRGLVAQQLLLSWDVLSWPYIIPLSWTAVREPSSLDYVWTVDRAGAPEGAATFELSRFKGKGTLSFKYRLVTLVEPDPDASSSLTVLDAESDKVRLTAKPSTSNEWITASISFTKKTNHGLVFAYQQKPDGAVVSVRDVRWTPAGSGASYLVKAYSEFEEAGYTKGSGYYAKKAKATLAAKANPGWKFVGWYTNEDKLYSKSATVSFKVTKAVTLYAGFLPSVWVGAIPDTAAGGSIAGAGYYAKGTKVTLTAKPAKGCVFAGWYVDGAFVSAKAALPLVAGDLGDVLPRAKFISSKTDLNSMKLAVDGAAEAAWKKSGVRLTRGLAAHVPLAASGKLGVSVSVSGLPKGLSYNKTLGAITGVPSVASAVKKGKPVPTKAKVTLKSTGGTVKKYTLPITVQNLPAAVRTTFNGGWKNGRATFTVAASGKISGKMLHDGVTETLTANAFAACYATNATGVAYLTTNAVFKTAAGTRPATVVVVFDSATGESKMTVTVPPAGEGGEELTVEAWKGHAAAADARAGETIAVDEHVSLVIGANGSVKAVGTWGTYRAVVATTFVGDGTAFVYFPPNATRRFDGWFKDVPLGP